MDIIKNFDLPLIKNNVYGEADATLKYVDGIVFVENRKEKYSSLAIHVDKILGAKEAYQANAKMKLKEGSKDTSFTIIHKYTINYLDLEYTMYNISASRMLTDKDWTDFSLRLEIPTGAKIISVINYFIQQGNLDTLPDVLVKEFIIEEFIKNNYPDSQIKYKWAAQDCISLDSIPYVGNYSKNTPNLYAVSGFNKWGMTGAMTAAMVITDMIIGKNNPLSEVFNPSRSILKPQLLVNGFEAVTNLLTPTKKRCPHLGCALKWNPTERSWDCPCHGSRFTEDGKVLENPANGNLKD